MKLALWIRPSRLSVAVVFCIGWHLLLAGTDTAAFETPASVAVEQTKATLTVRRNDQVVLVYNKQSPPLPDGLNPRYQRSGFIHPVMSPSGRVVTATFPKDHPHQHGIFSAWVRTTWNERGIDFWNLAGGTGRVLHHQVIRSDQTEHGVEIETELIHRAEEEPIVDVLKERWKITVPNAATDYQMFDLETRQEALTELPLIIHEYHYGGMALRGPGVWLSPDESDSSKIENQKPDSGTAAQFLNDLGSDRITGNHQRARWVAMSGNIDGHAVTIAVLSHRDNFRAPQAVRMHPTKPYFTFAPCVNGEFVIDREHPLVNRYRYLITDAPPDAAWLNEQWNTYGQITHDQSATE